MFVNWIKLTVSKPTNVNVITLKLVQSVLHLAYRISWKNMIAYSNAVKKGSFTLVIRPHIFRQRRGQQSQTTVDTYT